jgi:4-amino-4-deoxy-L-arabinose transferase-like glycosyltransferase
MVRFLAACALALVGFIAFASPNYSIKRSDESIHSLVAQEMAFFEGSLLKPTFFGERYLNKPPLQIFLTSRLIRLLGDENYVYRLLPALFGVGSSILLLLIANSYFGSLIPGIFAILCMASGRHIFFDHGIRVGVQDSALLFGVLLTIYGFLKERRFLVFLGIFIGTSVKWISGVLPAFFVFLWAFAEKRKLPVFALALGAIPAGIFLVYHLTVDLNSTLSTLRYNISDRLIGAGHHNQNDTFLYFRHLFQRGSYGASWMIWLGLLSILHYKNVRGLLLWGFPGLIVLSFLSSRLPWYLFPIVPSFWLMFGYVAWKITLLSTRYSSLLLFGLVLMCSLEATPIVRRAIKDNKIEKIDSLVESLKGTPVRIEGIDLMKDGSGGLSRRQLFYLRRLKIDQKASIAIATPNVENLFSGWNKIDCVNKENRKEKVAFCVYADPVTESVLGN